MVFLHKYSRKKIQKKCFFSTRNIKSVYKFVHTAYEYFASKPKFIYKKGIHMLLKRWQLVIQNDGRYIIN